MELIETKLKDLFVVKPKVFRDNRGFFLEFHSQRVFSDAGVKIDFVQDNHSLSVYKGVLRGLHFQNPPHAQTKLIRATRGSVYDVAVDLRKSSPTYGQWEGFELTQDNYQMLLIPKGFAHGFCTLAENTEFIYKNDAFYEPASEGGIRWNDPDLNIPWPVKEPILSEKDETLPFLKDLDSPFD